MIRPVLQVGKIIRQDLAEHPQTCYGGASIRPLHFSPLQNNNDHLDTLSGRSSTQPFPNKMLSVLLIDQTCQPNLTQQLPRYYQIILTKPEIVKPLSGLDKKSIPVIHASLSYIPIHFPVNLGEKTQFDLTPHQVQQSFPPAKTAYGLQKSINGFAVAFPALKEYPYFYHVALSWGIGKNNSTNVVISNNNVLVSKGQDKFAKLVSIGFVTSMLPQLYVEVYQQGNICDVLVNNYLATTILNCPTLEGRLITGLI